ncbi:MAG: response regulator [Chloroflexi bacterium]|nr:MAG: response regulator [Chloroflexota bacterium]
MSSGRILLVEDNEANQLLASSVLELSGFVVDVAGDSTEARAILARTSPDVILMDVQLPGLDGLSFVKQLKAEAATAHIPIIALTALAMAGDRERTLAAGCDGYIAKPINTRTFAIEVGTFLSDSQ